MSSKLRIAAAALAIISAWTNVADASSGRYRAHHRRGHAGRAAIPPGDEQAPYARKPFSFYPENIEGGVPGNLPFNNQLRKFSDPLNANGGGGA